MAKRIGETLGEADWRDTWRRGFMKRIGETRHLAKRIGEEGEEEKKEKKAE